MASSQKPKSADRHIHLPGRLALAIVTGAGLLLVGLPLVVWFLTTRDLSEDTPSGIFTAVSTAVYTLATIGLLVAAIFAGAYAHRAWQEQKRANDARDDAEEAQRVENLKAQAEKIAAWVDHDGKRFIIKVANWSDQAVYNIALFVHGHGEMTLENYETAWVGLVAPRTEHDAAEFDGNAWADMRHPKRAADYTLDKVLRQPSNWHVEIIFRDASGRDWTRKDNGALVEGRPEVPDPDADAPTT